MSLTLLCLNYGDFYDALTVTNHCRSVMDFEEVVIAHPRHAPTINCVRTVQLESPSQNAAWFREVPSIIRTTHCLSIHWDGFVIHPELWDESWMKYDFIGAPWSLKNLPNPAWRVGCGGFMLFSKRMADAWAKIGDETVAHDWQIGALNRDKYEALGMNYAPLDVALKFAKECDLEDIGVPEDSTFGFHSFEYNKEYRKNYWDRVYAPSLIH